MSSSVPSPSILPSTIPKPKFHLIMPTVQLSAMAELWGESHVLYIKGQGSFGSQTNLTPLLYGRIVQNIQNIAYLEWKWKEGTAPSIGSIFKYHANQGIPDVSIDQIWIRKMARVDNEKKMLELRYGKETVHPQDYSKLVVDGAIPKQELYETISQTKKTMEKRGLPPEILKRMRYSGLVLYDILPRKELMHDAYAMLELWEVGMMFGREIFKKWTLWDYEIRRRP